MDRRFLAGGVIAVMLAVVLSGCGRNVEQRAATGGMGGAATGALLGGPVGAVVGGAAGAGAGAMMEEGVDEQIRDEPAEPRQLR